jgi:hypothetical protein
MRQHLAFSRRPDGKQHFRGVSECHEIAENIPQRSREPATFRWACA